MTDNTYGFLDRFGLEKAVTPAETWKVTACLLLWMAETFELCSRHTDLSALNPPPPYADFAERLRKLSDECGAVALDFERLEASGQKLDASAGVVADEEGRTHGQPS